MSSHPAWQTRLYGLASSMANSPLSNQVTSISFTGEEKHVQVRDIRVTPVTVPLEAPLRWSMGVETGTTRAIVEVMTDEGVTGIGETYGGNEVVHAIETAKPFVLGLDPLQT